MALGYSESIVREMSLDDRGIVCWVLGGELSEELSYQNNEANFTTISQYSALSHKSEL